MNNKPKNDAPIGRYLNRPCCTCEKPLYGLRETKRYCNDPCRYEFHRRANLQIQYVIIKGLIKYKKRNLHLLEMMMGPTCSKMWVNKFYLEKLGFRLEKCRKARYVKNGQYGVGKTIYLLPNYRIFKLGNLFLVERVKSDTLGNSREFKFIRGTHERYLWDPNFPSCNVKSEIQYEKIFEHSNQLNFGPSDLQKLDEIFQKFGVWRM